MFHNTSHCYVTICIKVFLLRCFYRKRAKLQRKDVVSDRLRQITTEHVLLFLFLSQGRQQYFGIVLQSQNNVVF